jgi:bifunctional DNase/RNase
MTHDLIVDLIANFEDTLVSVTITELVDGVFYALLQFANHDAVSARPSDAIALALRAEVPIYVADEVMDEAGQFVTDEDAGDQGTDEDSELAQFREFLDQIKPEDFS